MLDRDLAVRNYNLARSYVQLGLGDWAYSKAVDSVKSDPTNSSSQLFLAGAFASTRQRLGSAGSALLLYRLLSPANQNTFSLYNDYTPMFEMPYLRVLATGGLGAWEERRGIQDHSLEMYGGLPGLAFDVFGGYQNDRGFRRLNGDSTGWASINLVKWEPTVRDSLFAGYTYAERETGDVGNLNDFAYQNAPNFRQFFRTRQYEVGLTHRFSPASILLGYFTYAPPSNHQINQTQSTFNIFGLPIDLDDRLQVRSDREYLNVQLQQQLILGNHTFMGGFDYLHGHLKYRSSELLFFSFMGIPIFNASLVSDYKPPDRTYSFYLLDYWRVFPNLLVELGVFKDFSKNSRVGFERPLSNSLWSPRLGVNWKINPQHTLRFALQRHLSTHSLLQPNLLVPAEVASFPWQINVDDGALVREIGFAWEAQWNSKTSSVVRLNAHRIDVPQYETAFDADGNLNEYRVWWGWKRYLASLIVNRILTPYLGLTLGATGKRIVPDPNPVLQTLAQDFSEFNTGMGLAFLHRTGWQGGLTTFLVKQQLKNRASNPFGLVDLRLGKEFNNKRGMFMLEVTNLLNRHFYFQREFVTLDAFFPARRVMGKLAFYF